MLVRGGFCFSLPINNLEIFNMKILNNNKEDTFGVWIDNFTHLDLTHRDGLVHCASVCTFFDLD